MPLLLRVCFTSCVDILSQLGKGLQLPPPLPRLDVTCRGSDEQTRISHQGLWNKQRPTESCKQMTETTGQCFNPSLCISPPSWAICPVLPLILDCGLTFPVELWWFYVQLGWARLHVQTQPLVDLVAWPEVQTELHYFAFSERCLRNSWAFWFRVERSVSQWEKVNLNRSEKPVYLCFKGLAEHLWGLGGVGLGSTGGTRVHIAHPSCPTDAEEVAQWVPRKRQARIPRDAKRSRELFSEPEVSLSGSRSRGLSGYRWLIKKPEAWNHLLLSCSFSLVRISWGSVSRHVERIREPWEIPSKILGS